MPEVVFHTSMPQEAHVINCFLEHDWAPVILERHPELQEFYTIDSNNKLFFLESFIRKFYIENKEEIEQNHVKYEKAWRQIEKECFKAIQEIVGTDWPEEKPTIRSLGTIIPICPRFLDDWSFGLDSFRKEIKGAMHIIAHECFHFLYFKKWKELYPNSNPQTFEAPHPIWLLSELAASVALNDSRINRYTCIKSGFYPEHEKVAIHGKPVPKFFTDLYSQSSNFEDFLAEGYEVVIEFYSLFYKNI